MIEVEKIFISDRELNEGKEETKYVTEVNVVCENDKKANKVFNKLNEFLNERSS